MCTRRPPIFYRLSLFLVPSRSRFRNHLGEGSASRPQTIGATPEDRGDYKDAAEYAQWLHLKFTLGF